MGTLGKHWNLSEATKGKQSLAQKLRDRKPPRTGKCDYCGAVFKAKRYNPKREQRFCSKKCSDVASILPKVETQCTVCGEMFYRKEASVVTKTCSPDCRGKQISKSKYRYGEPIQKQCAYCKNEIKVLAYLIKRGKGIYCSPKCFSNASKNKIEQKCLICGKMFMVVPSRIKNGEGKYCSFGCRNIGILKLNRSHTGHRSGKRLDLNNQYFRSSWEANYARYLNLLQDNKQIKKWEFEPDTFWFHDIKRGTRTYTPDFKIFNINNTTEYHEVKGYMDAKSRTKLNRMAKYYPQIKVVIISKKEYQEIHKKTGRLIPNWESTKLPMLDLENERRNHLTKKGSYYFLGENGKLLAIGETPKQAKFNLMKRKG